MKISVILLVFLIIFSSGCLDKYLVKETVLTVNYTLEGNGNKSVIKDIKIYHEEVAIGQAPKDVQPAEFPATSVVVVQKMNIISYMSGKDYKGPGQYEHRVGFEKEPDRNEPIKVQITLWDENARYKLAIQAVLYNWTVSK